MYTQASRSPLYPSEVTSLSHTHTHALKYSHTIHSHMLSLSFLNFLQEEMMLLNLTPPSLSLCRRPWLPRGLYRSPCAGA